MWTTCEELSPVHRPALVLGAAALLSLAACASPGTSGSTAAGSSSGGAAASSSSSPAALDGNQSYGAVVDLYSDLTGGTLQCTGLSPQVGASLVKAQATCTTASGAP